MSGELRRQIGSVDSQIPAVLEAVPWRVPFSFFALTAISQLGLALLALQLADSQTMAAELTSSQLILPWIVLLALPLSLAEYIYHKCLIQFGRPKISGPIMFPVYAGLLMVAGFLLVLGVPLKLLLPTQPVLVSVIFAVMLYYSVYEIWRATLHLPFDRCWAPLMRSSLVRRVYGFHLTHRQRPKSNLSIVGFWGIALWDYMFGTYRRPAEVPVNASQGEHSNFEFQN